MVTLVFPVARPVWSDSARNAALSGYGVLMSDKANVRSIIILSAPSSEYLPRQGHSASPALCLDLQGPKYARGSVSQAVRVVAVVTLFVLVIAIRGNELRMY